MPSAPISINYFSNFRLIHPSCPEKDFERKSLAKNQLSNPVMITSRCHNLARLPHKCRSINTKALPDGQSIRMLTLPPGVLDDLLEGKLDLVNIASPGNYEPLSYVWGEPDRCHEIICNSQRIGLTTSLHDAL